jgi:dipeptidyl aminopeptidase/acylaminoacyl peptidase
VTTADRTALPFGAWPSALSPQAAASAALGLGYAQADGRHLYWVESRPQEAGRSALMRCALDLLPLACEEVEGPRANVRSRVHEYGGRPYAVHGGRVLYSDFRSQALHMVGRPDALSPDQCRYADAAFSTDGRWLYAVREDHRGVAPGQEPCNGIVRLAFDPLGQAQTTAATPDAGELLHGSSDFVAWPRPSSDGRHLAFVAWRHPSMPWDSTELHVLRFGPEGEVQGRQLVAEGAALLEPQWAQDGSLYFLSDRDGAWTLWRWDPASTAAAQPVPEASRPGSEWGGPLWNLGLCTYALDGARVLVRLVFDAAESLWLFDLETRQWRALPLRWSHEDQDHELHADRPGAINGLGWLGAQEAYVLAAPNDGMPALLRLNLASGHCEVIRSAGRPALAAAAVSRAQPLRFPTQAGPQGEARQAHAWFHPPTHPLHRGPEGEKPPLLVLLHGGPTSHSTPSFALNPQFWASRGFAVVNVNYGGSTGFGRAYRERLRGQWGVVDLADAVAAVDELVRQGLVDGQRVAIRGGSAGGFTVLCALAFTRRFTAGINYFGVADLKTLVTDTHKFEARYLDSLIAPLPEGEAVYRARSPVHHMHQAHGALLTLQGSVDEAVPPQQSRSVVAAAKAAGCRVAYIEFEGEGHGFRQGPNIVRGLQAELAFLGEVFGFTPADAVPPTAWL